MHTKLAILAPEFPPIKGGVSDYTEKIHQEFLNKKIPTIVITRKNSLRIKNDYIFEIEIPVNHSEVQPILKQNNITDLLIEYTPNSFNPKMLGVNLKLISLLFKIRKNTKIHLYAHETNFPIQLTKAGIILGPIHTLQFYFLCLLSKSITFSTKRFENKWKRLLPGKSDVMNTVPIGSNIEAHDLNFSEKKDNVIFFGSKHPTCLKEIAKETLLNIAKSFPDVKIIVLGLKEKNFPISEFRDQFFFPGHIKESEISKYYKTSFLSILPLLDGCSTRRGTLMCSLAHGVPVLTNFGESTDSEIDWTEFCYISDKNNFSQKAVDIIKNRDLLLVKQKPTYDYYKNNFSWPIIAAKLLKIINKP